VTGLNSGDWRKRQNHAKRWGSQPSRSHAEKDRYLDSDTWSAMQYPAEMHQQQFTNTQTIFNFQRAGGVTKYLLFSLCFMQVVTAVSEPVEQMQNQVSVPMGSEIEGLTSPNPVSNPFAFVTKSNLGENKKTTAAKTTKNRSSDKTVNFRDTAKGKALRESIERDLLLHEKSGTCDSAPSAGPVLALSDYFDGYTTTTPAGKPLRPYARNGMSKPEHVAEHAEAARENFSFTEAYLLERVFQYYYECGIRGFMEGHRFYGKLYCDIALAVATIDTPPELLVFRRKIETAVQKKDLEKATEMLGNYLNCHNECFRSPSLQQVQQENLRLLNALINAVEELAREQGLEAYKKGDTNKGSENFIIAHALNPTDENFNYIYSSDGKAIKENIFAKLSVRESSLTELFTKLPLVNYKIFCDGYDALPRIRMTHTFHIDEDRLTEYLVQGDFQNYSNRLRAMFEEKVLQTKTLKNSCRSYNSIEQLILDLAQVNNTKLSIRAEQFSKAVEIFDDIEQIRQFQKEAQILFSRIVYFNICFHCLAHFGL